MKIILKGSSIVSAFLPALVVASLVASYSSDPRRRLPIRTYGVRGTGFILSSYRGVVLVDDDGLGCVGRG